MTEERLQLLASALNDTPSALVTLAKEAGEVSKKTTYIDTYQYIGQELYKEVCRLRDEWSTQDRLDHIIDLLSQCKEVVYTIRDREYEAESPSCPYISSDEDGTSYCTLGAPPATVTFEGFPCEGIFKVWYADRNAEKIGSAENFSLIGGLPEPDPMALARVMVNKDWLLDHLRKALDGGSNLNDVADLLLQAARCEIEKGEVEGCP